MVREELKMSPRDLPELDLQSVWRALDADSSGFISAGEFGGFMRKGKKSTQSGLVAHAARLKECAVSCLASPRISPRML